MQPAGVEVWRCVRAPRDRSPHPTEPPRCVQLSCSPSSSSTTTTTTPFSPLHLTELQSDTNMTSEVPKATLYTFQHSIWAAAPRLTLIEKGYSPSDLHLTEVNLINAENFDPSFLRINSKGTIPTLVVPLLETTSAEVDTKFRALTDTKTIVEFLDKSRSPSSLSTLTSTTVEGAGERPAPTLAPATIEGKAASDDLIKLVHEAGVDPNFLLIGARDEGEFEKAKAGLAGTFVSNRNRALLEQQKALENSASTKAFDGTTNPKSTAVHENLKKWYANKLASQTIPTTAYLQNDPTAKAELFQLTNQAWSNVAKLLAELEGKVQGPFALGDQISLADLHLIPWLAGVGLVADAIAGSTGGDVVHAIDTVLAKHAGHVGPKLKALWTGFSERPSFQSVYGGKLH